MNKINVLTLSNEYIVMKCFFMSIYHRYELQIDSGFSYFRTSIYKDVDSLYCARRKIQRFVRDNEDSDFYSYWFVVYTYDCADNHFIDSYCISLTGFAREYKNYLEVKKV